MEMAGQQPGSLFANRFEIEREAGSGGMGTVYRARDRYSGDFVALKLLHPDRALGVGAPDQLERFAREGQLLSELRHLAIVAYVTHGQTPDGQHYLAMEWLDGYDLGQRLSRGCLSLHDALLIVRRVAQALSIAHQHGILHRDLKPTNIFLPDGDIARCKVLDFGIARRMADTRAMTRTGMVVGTPEYMAPEQARGARELTPAADIFSLGCVFYECLTGEPPFVAEHVAAVLVRILFDQPVPITDKRPGLPSAVAILVGDMLSKDVAQRIPDAGALLRRIAELGELPEPSPLPTLAAPSMLPSGFLEHEQVLFSLVMAAASWQKMPLASTIPATDESAELAQRAALLSAVRMLGARGEYLVNGALLVTMPQTGSAQDQATMAARVALLVKERWPQASVAVTTGRGTAQGTMAIGEVADRAVQLVTGGAGQNQTPSLESISGVWIDELSLRLLGPRFSVVRTAKGPYITGEEKDLDESRPLLGKPTPCVGRETELSTLEAQLLGCIDEAEARAVLVTAPPGAGKSRLRHEFLRRAQRREEPITLLLGRGDIMYSGAPYAIIGDALRRLCEISGSEPPTEQRRLLRARLSRHLPESDHERVVLFVGELAGVLFPEDASPMLPPARQTPKIMRDRMQQAFLDWLAAECAAAPVLLMLDDLQWADALSVELLGEALRECQRMPLFILALGRPELRETFPKLWQGHGLQEIPLKPLSKRAGERLVQQVLGMQVAPELVARIVEQSAGNALMLEELIRGIADGKDSEAETVVAMLQARLGRFAAGPRRVVRAAAVFGQTFWLGGVEAVLGLTKSSAEIESWLAVLSEAEVIEPHRKSRLANEQEFGFRHALVRDAAYSLLTPSDLKAGHLLAARYLEAAGERDAAAIAGHYEKGGDGERSANLYSAAAEGAFLKHDLRAGGAYVERGISCGAAGETLGALYSVQSSLLLWDYNLAQSHETANMAMSLARPGSRSWIRAVGNLITLASFGSPAWKVRLPELLKLLLIVELEPEARSSWAEVLAIPAVFLAVAVPRVRILPLLDRLSAIVEQEAPHDPLIRRWYLKARCHVAHHQEPRPWSILTDAQEGDRLCVEAGDIYARGSMLIMDLEMAWLELGDLAVSERLRRHRALFAKNAIKMVMDTLLQQLSLSLIWLGSPEALAEAEQIARAYIQSPTSLPAFQGQALDNLARVKLRRGETAVADAQRACELLAAAPCFMPNAHATLIWALLAEGRAAEAAGVAEKGLGVLHDFRCVGNAEVELRLAISEAIRASSQIERSEDALRETLRQIHLRAEDITDPFWKTSYLTRNPYCFRTLQLAKTWNLDDGVR